MARQRQLPRRRHTPWGLWFGCLAAALLAHSVMMIPSTRALARSLGAGFEPKEIEDEVLSLALVEPEPEPEQFVEPDRQNDRVPEKTRRVSDRNSDVERETLAPPGEPQPTAVAGTTPGQPAKPSDPVDPDDQGDQQDELVDADDGTQSGTQTPAELAKNWGKLGGSPGVLHDAFGTAGSRDRLPDVERGKESVLDSKAHLYSSFFSRMRGRIYEHWNAQKAIDRYDPRGTLFGAVPRTTVVLIRLDRSGAIVGLSVEQDSDVDYLDAEAVRALKAAAPFPNPPDGLFDDNDEFVIPVALTVEPGGGTRIFRHSR